MARSLEEVRKTRWGQVKLWVHFSVVHPVVLPWLPSWLRTEVYKVSRRWVFGPNAHNEDLIALLQHATLAVKRG